MLHCERIVDDAETHKGWWLYGTNYDKRAGIKNRLRGTWNKEKRAWLIPEQQNITSERQLLQRYRKLPYDLGSRSEHQQIKRKEQIRRQRAYRAMHNRVKQWMEQPLSSLSPTKDLQLQSVSASHSTYTLITGPCNLVQQEIEKSCYLCTKHHKFDRERNVALAITYNDTS